MFIKQLSIFAENRKGCVAELAEVLANAGIEIRALYVADTSDFGIVRIIADKPEEAAKVLKEQGHTVSLTDVIAANLSDAPGGFARVVRTLSDHDIDVEYMYAFITRVSGNACVILRIKEAQQALDVFAKSGIAVLTSSAVYNM
ncbi:MAG: acetolactate synthase [Oscillospiraceae bacterium]|jgi:hypothetical protein|nr:acetolactate synthase [Oscillospiraceae bacterium]